MDKPELAVGHAAERAAARLLSPGRRAGETPSWRPWPGASAPIASAATSPATARRWRSSRLPRGVDHGPRALPIEAVWLGRDLINTPASDMGPQELEDAARAARQEARRRASASIVGDDLLAKNFPMIHAVGRASARAPRLIDLSWRPGPRRRTAVTLVGKGICFDTGGLDIKPASGMLIMKKDMGGAASSAGARPYGHGGQARRAPARPDPGGREQHRRQRLPPRRRADEPGRARPWRSATPTPRAGWCSPTPWRWPTRSSPDTVVSFATLTGAARVALGPDLPPFYTDDDDLAGAIAAAGDRVGDPVWRMPFWPGYEASLESAGRRHEQRLRGAVCRLGDGGAVPAPLRQAGASASRISTSTAGGRRPSRSAPRVASRRPRAPCSRCCAASSALSTTESNRCPAPLDPRRNAYRADLAAETLRGRVRRAALCGGRAAPGGACRRAAAWPRRMRARAGPQRCSSARSSRSTSERDGWAWVQLGRRRLRRLRAPHRRCRRRSAADPPGEGAGHVPLPRQPTSKPARLAAAQHELAAGGGGDGRDLREAR